jgi:hypothetical protein
MGIGLRVFILNDDDTVNRFPLTRYERLLDGDPKERLLQYAGKKIRFAEVAVEYYQREPIRILRLVPFVLHFDSAGSIDITEMDRERRLSMEAHPFLPEEETIGTVIDARRHFAKKRYDHRYRWKLTEQIVIAIATAIFGGRSGELLT